MVVNKIKPPNKTEETISPIVNENPKPIDKYFPYQEVRIGKIKKWIRMPNTKGCLVSFALLAMLLFLILLIIKILS